MSNIKPNEILVIYNSVSFFSTEIEKKGYNISPLTFLNSKYSNFFERNLKKLKLSESLIYGNWKNKLNSCKMVILFSPLENTVLEYIKRKNNKIRIVYWYWNPAYRIGRPNEIMRKLSEVWTFDLNDAENYQLKYGNTFYFNTIESKQLDKKFDIVFVGRNKKRKETLLAFQDLFKSKDLNAFFHIVPNRNEPNPHKIEELSYESYLDLIQQSKAILDIMPPSQVGLTLRPMESLFLGIKLITNNPYLKREPFYHPNNVFILGEDSEDDLKDFLDLPMQQIGEEIKAKYDFDTWAKRLVDEEEFKY